MQRPVQAAGSWSGDPPPDAVTRVLPGFLQEAVLVHTLDPEMAGEGVRRALEALVLRR